MAGKYVPTDPKNARLEQIAAELSESGDYRVLRRLDVRKLCLENDGTPVRRGVFLDVETTGLDLESDEIIELAMVPFDYTEDGRIFDVGEALHQLNEPSSPVTAKITALTGITNEDLAGKSLNLLEIDSLIDQSVVIVAHNAEFDRPFVEKISTKFSKMPWACTLRDIAWHDEGFNGRRLSDLLAHYSYFFDAHRATDDCLAGIGLLTMKLPASNEAVLAKLLGAARRTSYRIFAVSAAFEKKDTLKERGYRWNTDLKFGPKSWYTEVSEVNFDQEIQWLQSFVLPAHAKPVTLKLTARERYSKFGPNLGSGLIASR
ncbi:3'-5' exonuclease [Sulfitobacter sp. G21635-S1]|uniref:3'-5' exonuclease n=1 Tax=Sulfitobacter sp. G21635-S1 TaxID=3014043 RepID=UPI0022AEE7F8|nr:3'-5' exonuclease [Sulfitobacter sp. G21635-S1]MCZ4259106.1 3'-5' exonuclease [Sulfitobacter sp. G21635-S1]